MPVEGGAPGVTPGLVAGAVVVAGALEGEFEGGLVVVDWAKAAPAIRTMADATVAIRVFIIRPP